MSDSQSQPASNLTAEQTFELLSQRQYLRPHRSLVAVLADLEFCPTAVDHALRWLKMDPSQPIGRMRATELRSLAQCVRRLLDQWEAKKQQPQLA